MLNTMLASDGCVLAEVVHPLRDGTHAGLSLARGYLDPEMSTRPHRLGFEEVYYFLKGRGVMHLNDEAEEVGPDDCVYAPAGSVQWLKNRDPKARLVFLCVCHPAYDPALDECLAPT